MPPTNTSSPWHFGGLTKRELARRTWRDMQRDDLLNRSAQLAYYYFFSIFPLIIFLTALLGLFAGHGSHLVQRLTGHIVQTMPGSANSLVRKTIQRSLAHSGGGKLAFGIVVALFTASSGMAAMIQTLNHVFDADKERPLLRQRWTALWLTVLVGILICAAVLLMTVGDTIAGAVAGGAFAFAWEIGQYLVAIFFLLLSFSVVYRFAPNVEEPRWGWISPGAVAGVCIWLLASLALRGYLHYFDTYSSDYGTMGAVMGLLLWFYLTGLAFLIGGEIDGVIDRAITGRSRVRPPAAEALRKAA